MSLDFKLVIEIFTNKRSLQVKGYMYGLKQIMDSDKASTKIEVSENFHFLICWDWPSASRTSVDSAGDTFSSFNSRNTGSFEW